MSVFDDIRIDRRSFLRGIGLLVGGMIAVPFSTVTAAPLENASDTANLLVRKINLSRQVKVGLLLPESKIYPQMGENLAAGCKVYFEQAGAGASIETVTASAGVSHASALAGSRELIEKARVDLVIAMLNPLVAGKLQSFYAQKQVPLIVSSLGENATPVRPGPYLFSNSLALWQSSYAMGAWAAEKFGKKGLTITSAYDSGYDFLYTFQLGLEAAGGALQGLRLVQPGAKSAEAITEALQKEQPDFIFAAFSGQEAIEFVNSYVSQGLNRKIPLLVTPFAVDENNLAKLGMQANGIYSVFSWAAGLKGTGPQAFNQAFRKVTGQAADAIAVLGYDTARLVSEVLHLSEGEVSRSEKYAGALEKVSFTGGRGELAMDGASHSLTAPLYLRQVRWSWFRMHNAVVNQVSSLAESDPRVQALQTGVRSGWTNPYLCA